ncbi:MAG: hypothetical protein ABJF10_00635 [Chthoniobacter sp.]|uniref:hypothetical protein n=1 Tax=Chthoniobacter sp. TaxID=2510640 RepID=UPI0032A9C6AD
MQHGESKLGNLADDLGETKNLAATRYRGPALRHDLGADAGVRENFQQERVRNWASERARRKD